jgi:hypothetical protein
MYAFLAPISPNMSHIAYFDETNGDVRHAWLMPSGWLAETVAASFLGQFTLSGDESGGLETARGALQPRGGRWNEQGPWFASDLFRDVELPLQNTTTTTTMENHSTADAACRLNLREVLLGLSIGDTHYLAVLVQTQVVGDGHVAYVSALIVRAHRVLHAISLEDDGALERAL